MTSSGIETRALEPLVAVLASLCADMPKVQARAINHAGGTARTKTVRALFVQMGLRQKTIRKAVVPHKASFDDPVYTLFAAGGDLGLQNFKLRETRRGASVFLGNDRGRVLVEGAFLRGGAFPNRTEIPYKRLRGGVFQRIGPKRLPIERQTSGMFIAEEMVTGASVAAFDRELESALPRRLSHEIGRVLGL